MYDGYYDMDEDVEKEEVKEKEMLVNIIEKKF